MCLEKWGVDFGLGVLFFSCVCRVFVRGLMGAGAKLAQIVVESPEFKELFFAGAKERLPKLREKLLLGLAKKAS